jgi:hypothetical protein
MDRQGALTVPRIDSYSFGMISIDGQAHTSDVKVFPDHVKSGWWRTEGHVLHLDDIRDVITSAPEAIIIGTGASGAMDVPDDVKDFCESVGIELIALPTREAVQKHNSLSESKRVITCLHLTC